MAWGLVLTGDSCRVGPSCEPCGLSMVETPSNFVRVCGVGVPEWNVCGRSVAIFRNSAFTFANVVFVSSSSLSRAPRVAAR